MIPFLDLGAAYRELKSEIDTAVSRVLASGYYISGPEVETFEASWADYCGAKHAVGVANGLDALSLTLRALNVGPGDEVIVPSNTFIATWLAVSAVGATIVPVEPDPMTQNIDARQVGPAITDKTKVILPVHLYGQPADLTPLIQLAKTAGIYVVEDAAQSHGAKYKGKRIGAHGDAICWSFYPGKNLGALGDAGAVTTNNTELADKIRLLGNYGSKQKYVNEVEGSNSRLDPIQAAVLGVKLKFLDEWTARRAEIADKYLAALSCTELLLPKVHNWADPSWHLFTVRSKERSKLVETLKAAGITSLIHYPIPPHLQKAYKHLGFPEGSFPVAENIANEILSLPIGPHLTQCDDVISVILNG